jgi:hypothetical protein
MLAILIYLPWLVQLPALLDKVGLGYWVERPDVSRLFTLLIVCVTNVPLPDVWVLVALPLGLISVMIGAMQTAKAPQKTITPNGLWILYLSSALPLLLFLFSQWQPVYVERALLASGVMFCIWIAWALTSTGLSKRVRNFLRGLLVIASAMGIYQHLTYKDFPYGPFQALDMPLKHRLESQDMILHSNKLTILPAMFFD